MDRVPNDHTQNADVPVPLEATVIGRLPNEMFRLRLADGREVVAHAAQNLRMAYVRLVPGDVVRIEISPFDHGKARITKLVPREQLQRQPRRHESTAQPDTPPPEESNS
ncbi:MAG: hypothetical protein NXI31_23820 [bacterium]|nr:hypothetical protein [bacterium]